MQTTLLESRKLMENTEVRLEQRESIEGILSYVISVWDLDAKKLVGMRLFRQLKQAREYLKMFKF